MKKVVLLGLFIFFATSVWSQDLKAIAYRAFIYLGNSVPEGTIIEDNTGKLVDNKHGDYEEIWVFELDANKIVKSALFSFCDSNRNNLSRILGDINRQVIIQGYKLFHADGQVKVYVTNDGPLSMAIGLSNSIMTNKSGRTYVGLAFRRLADMM